MVQEFVQWFGDYTPNVVITVSSSGTLPPAAPSNLQDNLSVVNEVEHHTLTWKDNSTNEDHMVLKYQDVAIGTWNTVTLAANTKQYPLGFAFKSGHTYTFYVQACSDTTGCSGPSNTITVDI
jgi:hypothetical protein